MRFLFVVLVLGMTMVPNVKLMPLHSQELWKDEELWDNEVPKAVITDKMMNVMNEILKDLKGDERKTLEKILRYELDMITKYTLEESEISGKSLKIWIKFFELATKKGKKVESTARQQFGEDFETFEQRQQKEEERSVGLSEEKIKEQMKTEIKSLSLLPEKQRKASEEKLEGFLVRLPNMSLDQLKNLGAWTKYCLQLTELRIGELKGRKDTLEKLFDEFLRGHLGRDLGI